MSDECSLLYIFLSERNLKIQKILKLNIALSRQMNSIKQFFPELPGNKKLPYDILPLLNSLVENFSKVKNS